MSGAAAVQPATDTNAADLPKPIPAPDDFLQAGDALLGAAILGGTSTAVRALHGLRPEHFGRPSARATLTAVARLVGAGMPVDAITAAGAVRAGGGEIWRFLGSEPELYVHHLVAVENCPTPTAWEQYRRLVLIGYARRTVKECASVLLDMAAEAAPVRLLAELDALRERVTGAIDLMATPGGAR